MSEAELDPRFGDDVKITTGEFLKYNYRELARLAVNGTAKQKQWLLSYLGVCNDGVEKQSLQKALERTRPE
ncbi:MAG: hypothetical protein DMF71_09400 [Acidobacteria bacterium]|nr:MAG: hypothetical protein DMF71_09400 [Acidobacteriota bacterium]